MSGPTGRQALLVGLLVAAWCGLWGSLSVANVASGTVLAVGALVVTGSAPAGVVRWRSLAHFAGLVALDLTRSTISVVREVLTPTDYTDEAVVAVPVTGAARSHLLLLTVAVTVTPGTAVVDTDADQAVLYLHLLHADRADETTRHVQRLARLACTALPGPGIGERWRPPDEEART